jgi:membrane protein
LFIAISIAGAVIGRREAHAELMRGLATLLGDEGAATISRLLVDIGTRPAAIGASILSTVLLVYGSTRLFSHLQRALDLLWDVQAPRGRGLGGKLFRQMAKRALAFGVVLLCALFLLASVLMRALLSRAADVLGADLEGRWRVLDHAGTFAVSLLLFSAVFKVLPHARVDTRDALVGAGVTALLFHLGKVLLGAYLGHKDIGSTFGAAGSLVMVMLWVHYSAQIFFLGAAFTAVWARHQGRSLEPIEGATRIRLEDG